MAERGQFWESLRQFQLTFQGPWLLLGDFDDILNADERIHESRVVRDSGEELETFLCSTSLTDLRHMGCRYTWSNGHTRCKLDRALVNDTWSQDIAFSHAFLF